MGPGLLVRGPRAPETVEAAAAPHAGPRPRVGALALVAFAFALPVAFSNRVFLWFVTPKAAIALVALGPGLVTLARMAWRRERAALFAAAFLGVATLATAFSDVPVLSLLGEYFSLNGLLLVAVCVAVWALGSWYGSGQSDRIVVALVAAATLNAAVGWLQVSVDLGDRSLAVYGDRAQGLMGNPVFFAGLCVGALWLVWCSEARAARPLVWWVLGGFLLGALALSGSRVGVAVGVLALAWFAGRHLQTGARRRAALLVLIAVAGLGLSLLPHGSGTVGRVAGDTTGGLRPRALTWAAALERLPERPLLGFGPGRYQAATSPGRELEVARYQGPDVLFSDAHDFPVEVLTTTGVPGFAAFAAWLVASGRRARGPLVGFAAVSGATMLLQPVSVALAPLALLALGVAAAPGAPRPGRSRGGSRAAVAVSVVLALAGGAVGFRLLQGDIAYAAAVRRPVPSRAATAVRLMAPWPQPEALRASIVATRARAGDDPRLGRRALALAERARERDPSDPHWWVVVGDLRAELGSLDRADLDYRGALELDPWSASALAGRYRVARARDDRDEAARIRSRLCRLGRGWCVPRG